MRAPRRRLLAGFILLFVSLIWGSAFAVQRQVANETGVMLFNGTRFLIGGLVLLPLLLNRRGKAGQPEDAAGRAPLTLRSQLGGLALAGGLLTGGAALQQWGMRYTTAGNAGFITGLYVIFVPIILTVLWRQRISPLIWLAAAVSVGGMFLLSTGGELGINRGDFLELAGAVLWAGHVILLGTLVKRIPVVPLAIGQYFFCALFSLLLGLLLEWEMLIGLPAAWFAILYTGVFSVGLGYTLQAVGQRMAAPSDAAVILSMEAVFAALLGWVILGETLTGVQMIGAGLMLCSVIAVQVIPMAMDGKAAEAGG